MAGGSVVHRFGPFELDPAAGRLFRGATRIPLSDPQCAILLRLLGSGGQVVSKETLADAGWGGAAVADNSIDQSISRLRKALGDRRRGAAYIETIPNRGYRFVAAVERTVRSQADAPADAALAPYRAFTEGRRELETLDRDAIQRARAAFERTLQLAPDYAPAHVGLAFACGLAFESTYVDAACDAGALACAVHHARQGTMLSAASGEAWSVLAFALHLNGERDDAVAAACKAVALEPDNWRHQLRLGYVSWGEERMRAAGRALALCPGLALAHWLTATVLVARGASDAALDALSEGCAAQAAQPAGSGSFPAVGLHLLRGLVLAARDRLDAAAEALTGELSSTKQGQLYARECAANTWYALGAIRLRQRRRDEAESAFQHALDAAPGHLFARAALGRQLPALDPDDPRAFDAAMARAVGFARGGRHVDAAAACRDAIAAASSPAAGWILPVEPLLNAAARPDIWAEALASVRQRAI